MTIAQELYDKLVVNANRVPDKTTIVLDCGCFDSVLGVDDFSINTTDIAVELFNLSEKERRKGLKFIFAVLIDDVGVVCSEDAMVCISKEDPHPETVKSQEVTEVPGSLLEKISKTTGFQSSRARLFSEKTARNRGIRLFKQKIKDTSLSDVFEVTKASGMDEEQLFCKLKNGSRVLMADMHSSAVWSGHCPLLMGMHYRDAADWAIKAFSGRNSVEIIDFSLNDDRGKVNAGAQVAFGVSEDQPFLSRITNVCFADEDADLYTIDTHERMGE